VRNCNKCHKTLSLDAFELAKRYRGGRMSVCRDCRALYRKKLAARPKIIRLLKTCSLCRLEKTVEHFLSDRRSLDGFASRCKECRRINRTPEDAEKARRRFLKWKFGITLEEYNTILEQQESACAICCQPNSWERNFDVDHNHATGAIRGILCSACNTAIGLIAEDPCRAIRLARYLAQHNLATKQK
jgi:hypothetical protein